jgi:hypothetical protein
MNNRHDSGGDSGSSSYSGGTAYGLHKGTKTILFIARDTFSQVRYMPNALGSVNVATTP